MVTIKSCNIFRKQVITSAMLLRGVSVVLEVDGDIRFTIVAQPKEISIILVILESALLLSDAQKAQRGKQYLRFLTITCCIRHVYFYSGHITTTIKIPRFRSIYVVVLFKSSLSAN